MDEMTDEELDSLVQLALRNPDVFESMIKEEDTHDLNQELYDARLLSGVPHTSQSELDQIKRNQDQARRAQVTGSKRGSYKTFQGFKDDAEASIRAFASDAVTHPFSTAAQFVTLPEGGIAKTLIFDTFNIPTFEGIRQGEDFLRHMGSNPGDWKHLIKGIGMSLSDKMDDMANNPENYAE